MCRRSLIYIGKTKSTNKVENREVAHSTAKKIAKEYFFNVNYKISTSYSKEYYAVILSDKNDVCIDIEKNILSKLKFSKKIRFMQDRKLWTIKECASKVCRYGIISVLRDTKLTHIKNIGEYEIWEVILDKKWYPQKIIIIYKFILEKIHVSFSIGTNKFIPLFIEVKNE